MNFFEIIEKVVSNLANVLSGIFLSLGSTFSLLSLLVAAIITFVYCITRLNKKRIRPNFKWLKHLFFPKWWTSHPSMRADICLFFINSFVTGALIGWGLLSYLALSQSFKEIFSNLLAPSSHIFLPQTVAIIIYSLALFIAYDFAYWLDHALKHKIPLLWEFHRVHHSAEKLSPLTAFRMHPVDSMIFYNITAIIMAFVNGFFLTLFKNELSLLSISGVNIFLLIFVFTTIHLQHSHIPIRFEGIWGKIFFSPAHHHLHHSNNPTHYGCNMGSCLAIWDLMFGTLRIPNKEHKNLNFGVPQDGVDEHSIRGVLLSPFERSIAYTAKALKSVRITQLFRRLT